MVSFPTNSIYNKKKLIQNAIVPHINPVIRLTHFFSPKYPNNNINQLKDKIFQIGEEFSRNKGNNLNGVIASFSVLYFMYTAVLIIIIGVDIIQSKYRVKVTS